jgi:cellulose synthase/poly-beta-1,6-N-acetylglucosamine synthase-like glycosyltransferase
VILVFSLARRRSNQHIVDHNLKRAIEVEWPSVVVQLPVYREYRVIDRLLSSVTKLDYPANRLCIQVLDDSEEDESKLISDIVHKYQTQPIPIQHIHRKHRRGYKSGALNDGNSLTNCELVAIFDADFIPRHDFLLRTVPIFQDAKIGAVHTRWSHLNDLDSPLTMLQAAILDSLFCFENGLRQWMKESSMYLGTSGVWRKQTIEELGGWREQPFTDDGIDLSFRAQINGWFVAYIDEALSSGELPETYLTYKNQQRRWARAAFRLFLDYWRFAFRPPKGLGGRFLELSSLHLVLSTPSVLFITLISGLFVALGLPRSPEWIAVQIGLTGALLLFPPVQEGLLSQILLYRDWPRRCLLILQALPLGIGVSVSILVGFWDTVRPAEAEFVTTPKQGSIPVIQRSRKRWLHVAGWIAAFETAFGLLILVILILAILRGYLESWLLFFTASNAFLVSGAKSWSEIKQRNAGLS